MKLDEAEILVQQLHKLRQDKPNFVPRLSPAQSFAIDWAWKELAQVNVDPDITILSTWLNNYDRACTAAQ